MSIRFYYLVVIWLRFSRVEEMAVKTHKNGVPLRVASSALVSLSSALIKVLSKSHTHKKEWLV